MITFHITQIIARCSIINIWQYHIYCFVHISRRPFVAKYANTQLCVKTFEKKIKNSAKRCTIFSSGTDFKYKSLTPNVFKGLSRKDCFDLKVLLLNFSLKNI